jgi:hypothetical protein
VSTVRRTAAGVLLVGLLAACSSSGGTGTGAEPQASAPQASTPQPAADDDVVATDGPRPSTAEVVLSTATWNEETAAVEAGGYLSPVVEEGGTCTLELTNGAQTRTAEVAAAPDATTTVCLGLSVPGTELGPGEWDAVLRYRSPGLEERSAPLRVEVPR